MRSKLNDHLETILLMRKQRKNFAEIAAYLTQNGCPVTRQNLGNFYRRMLKVAKKMRQELTELEFMVDQAKYPGRKIEPLINPESDIIESSKVAVSGPDDKWKPKIIRPPKKQPEPEKSPKKWDGFTIGPDVIQ
jgi:hypothetical protein